MKTIVKVCAPRDPHIPGIAVSTICDVLENSGHTGGIRTIIVDAELGTDKESRQDHVVHFEVTADFGMETTVGSGTSTRTVLAENIRDALQEKSHLFMTGSGVIHSFGKGMSVDIDW